jgi:hypothetical protein
MENNNEISELDHLKAAWNLDLQQQSESAEFLNHQNISTMMHQRTHSVISRLKRNLMIEITSTAVILAALYAYTLWNAITLPWYLWMIILVATFTGHILLYFSLRRQERLSESKLTEALDISITHTGRFIRTGRQFAWILALVIFFGGLNLMLALQEQWRQAWLTALLTIFAAFGAYFLANRYVEYLYGRYYRKLLACREELQQEG